MAFFKSVTVVTTNSCELDPMPTSFVKVAVGAVAPIITCIVKRLLVCLYALTHILEAYRTLLNT